MKPSHKRSTISNEFACLYQGSLSFDAHSFKFDD